MHTNKVTNKKYIGITRMEPKKRWASGHGYNGQPYFSRSIKKHGWYNFSHEILASNLSKEDAAQMERALIKKYETTNHNKGYNIQHGGFSHGKHSEETKKRLSQNHKGLMSGKKHHMYGKKHTNEARKKISEIQCKPVYQYDRYTGYFIARFDSTIQAEAKTGVPNSHISAICIGKMKTSHGFIFRYEDKENATYKVPLSQTELDKANTNSHFVRVKQFDKNGVYLAEFDSISEAAKATGASPGTISLCCRGKAKTSNGYIWKHA